jgi:hypothetical protein
MGSDEPLPELPAGWAAAEADEVPGAAAGLDVGVVAGAMLPMLPAGPVDVEVVGFGVAVGVPAGLAAPVAVDDVADPDDVAGAGVLFAGSAVTVTTPTACPLVGGSVAASAEAVRLTHVTPLEGVPISALRLNDDGVRSVPSDPSWHEADPLPLGQKPVNVALPADAASVTDTSGTVPFSAWT